MEFLSTLISLLGLAVLVAALLNPLRPLEHRAADSAAREAAEN